MNGPLLAGETAALVPPPPGFATCLRDWYADPAVTRYLNLRFPPTLEAMEDWLRKLATANASVVWAIRAEDRLIGMLLLTDIDWRKRRVEIGFSIGEMACWGKGYGSAAVVLATRFAFEELGLEKVQASAFAENVASRRTLEKAGYRQYGLARHDDFRLGRWHDTWLCEVLRDEWAANPSA